MIAQHLVDRLDLPELVLELPPVRLEHLARDEREHLLHEGHHLGSEDVDPDLPGFEVRRGGSGSPVGHGVVRPHARELELGVLELEDEPEEDLVPGDGLAGDDERDGELDGVVELEGFEGCDVKEEGRRVKPKALEAATSPRRVETHRSGPSSSRRLFRPSHLPLPRGCFRPGSRPSTGSRTTSPPPSRP